MNTIRAKALEVKIMRLPHAADLPLPTYQPARAGLDLMAAIPAGALVIAPGRRVVLRAMQHGCSLHLHYTTSGPQWALSDGRKVSARVAQLVTTSSSVVGCGDALFEGARTQSFRWWRDPACISIEERKHD